MIGGSSVGELVGVNREAVSSDAGGEAGMLGWGESGEVGKTCERTAPTAKSDASVVRIKGREISGRWRTGAEVTAVLRARKASSCTGVQSQTWFSGEEWR